MNSSLCLFSSNSSLLKSLDNLNCEILQVDSLDNICNANIDNNFIAFIVEYTSDPAFKLAAVRDLKEKLPSIPIILVSDEYRDKLSFWCLRNKMYDYVVYPAEKDHLLAIVKNLQKIKHQEEGQREPCFITQEKNIDLLMAKTNLINKKTQSALDYIEKHYMEKITTNQLAECCRLSSWQFSESFKKENNTTPREYIKQFRLQQAKALLFNTNLQVQQIAFNVGFDDVSHFNRLFKSTYSATPKNIRELAL